MKKIKYILFFVLLFGGFQLTAFSQIPEKVDTGDYYMFSSMKNGKKGSCNIDGKTYSKKQCEKISQSFHYMDTVGFANKDMKITRNNIRFVRYRYPSGIIGHTQYEVDPDLSPFGEYVNYYSNGNVKSIWQFEQPNDSLSNEGIMLGEWWYMNEKADTVGVKRFKDGLAHGKWVAWTNDSTRVIREYKSGLSEGKWSVDHYSKYSLNTRPYIYHNGFYSTTYKCYEDFETFLDKDENVFQKNRIITLERIESGEGGYIENGKFQIVRDGIIIELKELKDGDLIQHIKYGSK